ncbi:hypothetical protein G6F31_021683 [Rhizopus arrhizus]|nr:hypothetical protein G6F31_021683 [Rhizopus arrhizus]
MGQLQGLRPDGPDGRIRNWPVGVAGQTHPDRRKRRFRHPAGQALIRQTALLIGAPAPGRRAGPYPLPPGQPPPTASP